MTKKEYIHPTMTVVILNHNTHLLAGSVAINNKEEDEIDGWDAY